MRGVMVDNFKSVFVASVVCILLCGCSTRENVSPAAAGAVYTDPAGNGWRIIKEQEGTTANNIVLKLEGPEGVKVRGVGLEIRHGGDVSKVSWSRNSGGSYATHDDVFKLFNYDQTEPQAFLANARGASLSIGAFQKGTVNPAVAVNRSIFHFQMQVQAGLPRGTDIPIDVVKAQVIPETFDWRKNAWLTPVSVAVGKLTAE